MQSLTINPIAKIASPFTEKFGIPRQPGLAPSIIAEVVVEEAFSSLEAVSGLEQCSHIWLLFIFSESLDKGWKPRVRPPRLGGNEKLGVFASRSPFRPNPIGLSVVELLSISMRGKNLVLEVRGADLLDGTPIVDIKPYLPYADSLPEAQFKLAKAAERLCQPLSFSKGAQEQLSEQTTEFGEQLAQQIEELLRCDPRPAYQKDPERIYGVSLYQLNIRFSISDEQISVHSIERSQSSDFT
ncbi:MAG: tRNA (N6-threonylcarbamoyladenosine(37)-N6)-methyltransferase TrmO [Oceanospirillaceae bacterium]|nr:tRNA (N6-threonylcarbamoyladenosine(37)-N6)-methyltransferase TrmO [Oceanospirillaceae bacterium]